MSWRDESLSQVHAVAAGRAPDGWPAPCPVCGVGYKLTPAGRWFIEHAYPHHPPGVFATEPPKRLSAPKPRDPLLDGEAA